MRLFRPTPAPKPATLSDLQRAWFECYAVARELHLQRNGAK